MNQIKKLAGQTLVYGLGTIIPRFLHYAVLTPFYTYYFIDKADYGIITELYAWMVLLLVVLTYGMETGFFRFSKGTDNPERVYSTALISLLATSAGFIILVNLFIKPVSTVLNYENNHDYIRMFAAIVAMDAFATIPFAKLRNDNRPMVFSTLKIMNVLLTIGLVIFFLKMAPGILKNNPGHYISRFYNPDNSVGYVFLANLMSSAATLLILLPFYIRVPFRFDKAIWQRLIGYSFPLLIGGMAGSMNDVLDKIILRRMIGEEEGLQILGEYGAGYKIGVLMALFIQMFRFAAEPFFFEKAKSEDAKDTYGFVMKYFIITGLFVYLCINLYLPIIQFFIGPVYRDAIVVVPIISMAYLLYGIFINLSVWYKINDLTRFGAYLTIAGSIVTVIINLALIPAFGYMASAWAHVACYLTMVILSYILGRKYYPVPYEIYRYAVYIVMAVFITIFALYMPYKNRIVEIGVNTLLIIVFVYYAQKRDRAITVLFRS